MQYINQKKKRKKILYTKIVNFLNKFFFKKMKNKTIFRKLNKFLSQRKEEFGFS